MVKVGSFKKHFSQEIKWVCCIPACLLIISVSCTHEPEYFGINDTICFDTQVLPLIQNSCGISGCHDALTAEEGFIAVNYESILSEVEPGDPSNSKLYTVTTDIWGENLMPPDNPLSASQRNIIQIWIAQGAKNTVCDTAGSGGNGNLDDSICFVQDILPIFSSSCGTTGCHDAVTHYDSYNLTDYPSIMSDDEGIIPFDPESSKFFEVITEDDLDDRMPPPPRTALTTEQISMLRSWIEDGALNSDCPENSCDTLNTISFDGQVFPILQNNCLSCHGATSPGGGIALNNYTNVVSAVVTERSGISILVGSVRHADGFSAMPRSGNPLDECSIRTIEIWIEQGNQENKLLK
jgi:hypothetical protein